VLFKTFGGHAAAAGFSLFAEQLIEFQSAFETTLAKLLSPEDLLPRLYIEETIPLDQFNARLCSELESFEPCGAGNPKPVFAVRNASIPTPPKLMGADEQHVQFFVKEGTTARRVIGFNMAEHFNKLCDLSKGGTVDIACKPNTNEWQGETSVELIMESFKPSAPTR